MEFNSYKDDENLAEISKVLLIKRLFSYLMAYKSSIALILLLIIFRTAVRILNPMFIQIGIDDFIGKNDLKGLFVLGGVVVFINILTVLSVRFRVYMTSKITNKVIMQIRQNLYEHIQTLDFSFFDSKPKGKILSRIIADVNALKSFMDNCITTLVPEFGTLIAVLVIMFVQNAKLALAALCSVPLLAVSMFVIMIKSHKGWVATRKKSSNMSAFLHEDLDGMRIVQQFNAEDESNKEFEELTKDHKKSFYSAIIWADGFDSAIDITSNLGMIGLYFAGIKILGIDNVSVGTYIAFGTYVTMFWEPLIELAGFYTQLVSNISAAQRVFEVMDTQPEIVNNTDAVELPPVKGEVSFENVSFSYTKDADVLRDVSFTVKAGETIALVGPTGAGKTTIVSLISRFYNATSGRVLIDGYDVQNVLLDSMRSQMGIMNQETYLFSGTIRENIKYGRIDATDAEIEQAAKSVHADEFILKLPKGYDTELSERGGGLSNGQRQLIALARMMLNMPRILVLDEATSSIDTQTELFVQQGIQTLLKGRTSFVIAHRLSTIKNADRIFVIDKGGIIEQGSPDELMRKKGEYYKLYMAQFSEIA